MRSCKDIVYFLLGNYYANDCGEGCGKAHRTLLVIDSKAWIHVIGWVKSGRGGFCFWSVVKRYVHSRWVMHLVCEMLMVFSMMYAMERAIGVVVWIYVFRG